MLEEHCYAVCDTNLNRYDTGNGTCDTGMGTKSEDITAWFLRRISKDQVLDMRTLTWGTSRRKESRALQIRHSRRTVGTRKTMDTGRVRSVDVPRPCYKDCTNKQ